MRRFKLILPLPKLFYLYYSGEYICFNAFMEDKKKKEMKIRKTKEKNHIAICGDTLRDSISNCIQWKRMNDKNYANL